MKRTYFTLFLISASIYSAKAQLQVDSTGYVGIGVTDDILEDEEEEAILSPFTVCSAGSEDVTAAIDNAGRHYTLTIHNAQNGNINGTALQTSCSTKKGQAIGLLSYAFSDFSGNNPIYAVKGISFGAENSASICGGPLFNVEDFGVEKFAGVYGSSSSSSLNIQYPGIYAGYFEGTVRATGPMYAQAFYTPSATSNGTSGRALAKARNTERVSDKLLGVNMFELQHNDATKQTRKAKSLNDILKGKSVNDLTAEEISKIEAESAKEAAEEFDPLSSVNYGLDAEQLKAAFPKLVKQDAQGNYSINYIELIPLLVKGFNEMASELAELKEELNTNTNPTGIENTVSDVDMVKMDQNKPNPFSESTVIGLNIPEKAQKAVIYVYDMSGKQIKSIKVEDRGNTSITVYASDLNAGMYIYSLVVDGKVCVTRKMIVTNA